VKRAGSGKRILIPHISSLKMEAAFSAELYLHIILNGVATQNIYADGSPAAGRATHAGQREIPWAFSLWVGRGAESSPRK
jgi:hypothetical protein